MNDIAEQCCKFCGGSPPNLITEWTLYLWRCPRCRGWLTRSDAPHFPAGSINIRYLGQPENWDDPA